MAGEPREDERLGELAAGSDYFAGQAVRAFLDGELAVALDSSDRAIRDHEQLYQECPDDERVVQVLADRLRDRAEIRYELCRRAGEAGRTSEAHRHCRAGIADAERAIELHDASTDDPDPYPLWVPSVRLLLAELQAALGNAGAARSEAGRAIAAYRHVISDGVDPREDERALGLAWALARQADIVALTATTDESLAPRRESIELVRRHARPGGELWNRRLDRDLVWASTPTWRRFCQSASMLAACLEPPRPEAAPEALLALQDAAEGYAALVPDLSSGLWLADPHVRHAISSLQDTVWTMMRWLATADRHDLASRYEQTVATLVQERRDDWHAAVHALREPLEAALAP